jgi:hypothetical protein
MRSSLLLVVVALLVPAATGQTAVTQFKITELLLRPAFQPSPAQIIEITNVGDGPADLGQTQLCMLPFVSVKLADLIVPSGGIVRVHVGDSGIDTATDLWLPVGVPILDTTAGALLLTRWAPVAFPAGLCLDPANTIDYVQWGAPNQHGASVAVSSSAWPDPNQFLPVPDLDVSLALGSGAGLVGGWFRDATPTLGQANVTPSARVDLVFPACSPLSLAPIMTAGTPALGNLDFTVLACHQVPFSPATVFVGLGHTGTPIQSPFLCVFHVDQILTQIFAMADASGNVSIPWSVPHDTGLIGIDLSLQTVFFDGMFAAQPFQLSSGIAVSF